VSHRPTVSVVIPAFNAEATIGDAIASALGQTLADLNVIVVDDGSSDGTVQVATSVDDARVEVVSQPNAGAAAARNTGIAKSTGAYVALLDADDVWMPYKLERQIEILRGDDTVHAVQSGALFVDSALQVLSERRCRPSQDALLDTLRFQNMPNNMSTLVIERRMFEVMGCFDTSLEILEEWDMAIKVARHCNLFSIEEPLSLYRVHPGNRSRDLDIHIEPGLQVLARVFDDPTLPANVRQREKEIYGRFYTMLAGGALRNRRWQTCASWAIKAARTDPSMLGYMAELPLRHLSRWLSRRRFQDGLVGPRVPRG
jgi:glycosyltransferase involved in cell wall biosynthesis